MILFLTGANAEIRLGNSLPISQYSTVGTMIHNIEMVEGKWRSDGAFCRNLLLNCWQKKAIMPKSACHPVKYDLIRQVCYATIGQVGKLDHSNIKLG